MKKTYKGVKIKNKSFTKRLNEATHRYIINDDFFSESLTEQGYTPIFPDPKQHCLTPKWYCKFLFWMKHGEFTIKRIIV